MGDRNLNGLLKWSIENSTTTNGATPTGIRSIEANGTTNGHTTNGDVAHSEAQQDQQQPPRPVDPEVLAALFGGPSDAELMKAAVEVISSPDESIPLSDRLIAFDNLEQLIESIDNANNLHALSLWAPLLDTLGHDEGDMRRMGAWCVGTAVQNNVASQERLLSMGGIPRLVNLAVADGERADVRRKAVYALSSAVRNYQPAMDAAAEELQKQGHHDGEKVDAEDMTAVDVVMDRLREKASAASS